MYYYGWYYLWLWMMIDDYWWLLQVRCRSQSFQTLLQSASIGGNLDTLIEALNVPKFAIDYHDLLLCDRFGQNALHLMFKYNPDLNSLRILHNLLYSYKCESNDISNDYNYQSLSSKNKLIDNQKEFQGNRILFR